MIKRGDNMILTNDIIKNNLQNYSNKNTKIAYYSPKWISRRLDDVIDSAVAVYWMFLC